MTEEKEEARRLGGLAINTIHTMDCMEGMQRLPAGSADIIVTSPPYNIGKDYNTYDDQRPREDYLDWMGMVAAAAARVLADDGSFFLNVGGKPRDPWIPFDVAQRFRPHFTLQNVIH
ncbi:MAG: site-specific DNA-methyltransferase, partial [Methanomicrobiales archaeon]|nr:site-specific DNA-methyltransferase [Methanomicrobiales archaeon]